MNGRRLTSAVGLLLVAAACASPLATRTEQAASGTARSAIPPNVLLIVTDDQRSDEMVGMRRTREWLIRHGRRFPNAMVTTPLCCPSRASIFTGEYAHNTGVHSNADHAYSTMPQGSTVQAILQRAGYRTGIVGKYFNGWPVGRRPPFFDRWSIFTPGVPPGDGYANTVWNVDGAMRHPVYSTAFAAKRAVAYLRAFAAGRRPWFLYVAPFAPHGPAVASPACASTPVPPLHVNPAMRESDRSDKPPWVRAEHHTVAEMAPWWTRQLRALCSVDRMVGSLRRTLTGLHALRNTLVIYLSDNGIFLGEHALADKGYPYRTDLRVPLIIRWPGHVSPGTLDRRLAANVDVAPTILHATGLNPRRPMDGRSLLDLSRPRRTFLAEWWRTGNPSFPAPTWGALVTRRHEYIEYFKGSRVIAREYYDLAHDPWQLRNLLAPPRGPRPDVRSLHLALTRWRTCVGSACP